MPPERLVRQGTNAEMRWEAMRDQGLPVPDERFFGSLELLARATDRDGLVQPDTVPFDDDGYRFWAVVRHPVRVV